MIHSSPFSRLRAGKWLLGLVLATAFACSGGSDATHDAGTDAAPADGGADAGTDASADADSGTDVSTGNDAGACNAAAIAFPQGGTPTKLSSRR